MILKQTQIEAIKRLKLEFEGSLITKKNKQKIDSLKRKQITLRSALATQKSKKMKKENLKKI
jgi:hypothetical protein